jgi:hypothetical protein
MQKQAECALVARGSARARVVALCSRARRCPVLPRSTPRVMPAVDEEQSQKIAERAYSFCHGRPSACKGVQTGQAQDRGAFLSQTIITRPHGVSRGASIASVISG